MATGSGTPAIQALSSALAAQHVGGTNNQSSSESLVSPQMATVVYNVPTRLGSTTARTSTCRRLRSGSRFGREKRCAGRLVVGPTNVLNNSNCQSAGESLDGGGTVPSSHDRLRGS